MSPEVYTIRLENFQDQVAAKQVSIQMIYLSKNEKRNINDDF